MSIKPKEVNFEKPISHIFKNKNDVLNGSFDLIPDCVNSLTIEYPTCYGNIEQNNYESIDPEDILFKKVINESKQESEMIINTKFDYILKDNQNKLVHDQKIVEIDKHNEPVKTINIHVEETNPSPRSKEDEKRSLNIEVGKTNENSMLEINTTATLTDCDRKLSNKYFVGNNEKNVLPTKNLSTEDKCSSINSNEMNIDTHFDKYNNDTTSKNQNTFKIDVMDMLISKTNDCSNVFEGTNISGCLEQYIDLILNQCTSKQKTQSTEHVNIKLLNNSIFEEDFKTDATSIDLANHHSKVQNDGKGNDIIEHNIKRVENCKVDQLNDFLIGNNAIQIENMPMNDKIDFQNRTIENIAQTSLKYNEQEENIGNHEPASKQNISIDDSKLKICSINDSSIHNTVYFKADLLNNVVNKTYNIAENINIPKNNFTQKTDLLNTTDQNLVNFKMTLLDNNLNDANFNDISSNNNVAEQLNSLNDAVIKKSLELDFIVEMSENVLKSENINNEICIFDKDKNNVQSTIKCDDNFSENIICKMNFQNDTTISDECKNNFNQMISVCNADETSKENSKSFTVNNNLKEQCGDFFNKTSIGNVLNCKLNILDNNFKSKNNLINKQISPDNSKKQTDTINNIIEENHTILKNLRNDLLDKNLYDDVEYENRCAILTASDGSNSSFLMDDINSSPNNSKQSNMIANFEKQTENIENQLVNDDLSSTILIENSKRKGVFLNSITEEASYFKNKTIPTVNFLLQKNVLGNSLINDHFNGESLDKNIITCLSKKEERKVLDDVNITTENINDTLKETSTLYAVNSEGTNLKTNINKNEMVIEIETNVFCTKEIENKTIVENEREVSEQFKPKEKTELIPLSSSDHNFKQDFLKNDSFQQKEVHSVNDEDKKNQIFNIDKSLEIEHYNHKMFSIKEDETLLSNTIQDKSQSTTSNPSDEPKFNDGKISLFEQMQDLTPIKEKWLSFGSTDDSLCDTEIENAFNKYENLTNDATCQTELYLIKDLCLLYGGKMKTENVCCQTDMPFVKSSSINDAKRPLLPGKRKSEFNIHGKKKKAFCSKSLLFLQHTPSMNKIDEINEDISEDEDDMETDEQIVPVNNNKGKSNLDFSCSRKENNFENFVYQSICLSVR